MHKHRTVTEGRIVGTLNRIWKLVHTPAAPLQIEAHHLCGEPVPLAEAMQKTFLPFAVGDEWGPAWDTTWFRFSGAIPSEWRGREVVALVGIGARAGEGFTAEGLVWRNDAAVTAINVNRATVPLVKSAGGGEYFDFYVEAASNPTTDLYKASVPGVDPARKPLFSLERAEIACFNRETYDFYCDFKVAQEAMFALPENSARRGQLLYALNNAANLFDEDKPASIAAARAEIAGVLGKRNGDTAHQVSAIGHAHIDTAWLWPLRETIRKCARTFVTALAYMEEHPDYVFGCSQPQHYAWMKEFYPAIYEGIKKAVARGQWEPLGAMWVEADCNIPSGESLVRQILHGKNFFLDEFGIDSNALWLPDVFGYCASLPQILQKAGVKYFVTQKISWNQFNDFPHHTFLWEGIDGSQVFAHFPPSDTYNGDFTPQQIVAGVENFRDHDRATRSLYIYGYGDGGGGPTPQMLEAARRLGDFEGMPKITQEKVGAFLSKAEADARDLQVWCGELYLELHRGTYTTHSRIKKSNRQNEVLLHDAEFFDVVAGCVSEQPAPPLAPVEDRAVYDVSGKDAQTSAAYLDRAWKLLLLNQFHDIIPGTSINWVYWDSETDHATVRKLGLGVLDSARQQLLAMIDTSKFKRPYVVFNTCSHARDAVISLPYKHIAYHDFSSAILRDEMVSMPDGSPIHVHAPACGYAVIEGSEERPVSSFAQPVQVTKTESQVVVDNGILNIVFDANGFITSIFDSRVHREVLAPGSRANVFQLHKDLPNQYDAWDVDVFYRESCEEIADLQGIHVLESTELRATITVLRKFGKSKVSQNITIRAGSPRIDFHTEVDWQEEHQFLKVAFPVNVRSPRATYEIQYGNVERPTHYNTSWDLARFEVCAQKWADLSEGDYGVALINDCKYGYDIYGNVMRLSLLRAPTTPDPVADRGRHIFTYALLPHVGDHRQGQVVQQAYALNNPLQIVPADVHEGSLPESQSFFEVDRVGVVIEAVKKAERENAIIVRLYEAHGNRGDLTLRTPLPFKQAFTADLMERTLEEIKLSDGEVTLSIEPFEIMTLKFSIEEKKPA